MLYRSVDDPGLGQVLQLLVPKCLRTVIIEASHDKWGHQGVDRTLRFIKKRCYWPGMNGHVRDHSKLLPLHINTNCPYTNAALTGFPSPGKVSN